MSDRPTASVSAKQAWYRPMLARSAQEQHRAATPLELLFDLCFVVAVALAAASLHHALTDGQVGTAVLGYVLVFFAIWWAWMNFTWFASAYDTDDVPYRLATLVEIAGVLILAAGVPRAFDRRDFTVVALGYVVMRMALVGQWLRAAGSDRGGRPAALRYAIGVTACQVGWLVALALPVGWGLAAFPLLALAELLVPVWAERAAATAWHPRHIAERYGLFALIVLGESMLAATTAIQAAIDAGQATLPLLGVAASGLVIVFGLWWLYFAAPTHRLLTARRLPFIWGYGHLLVFSAAAAVGAGLQVAVDHDTGTARLSAVAAGAATAVPVAVYLLSVWALQVRPYRPGWIQTAAYPITAVVVVAAAATPLPHPLIALLLVALLATSMLATSGGQVA